MVHGGVDRWFGVGCGISRGLWFVAAGQRGGIEIDARDSPIGNCEDSCRGDGRSKSVIESAHSRHLIQTFERLGIRSVRQLPDGRWIGIQTMLFTTALMVGIDATGYVMRYCYEQASDAEAACRLWTGSGDPPGPWIKAKGEPGGDRLGPGAIG